jgi:hypothetical protein
MTKVQKEKPITKTRRDENTKEEGLVDFLALFSAFVIGILSSVFFSVADH